MLHVLLVLATVVLSLPPFVVALPARRRAAARGRAGPGVAGAEVVIDLASSD